MRDRDGAALRSCHTALVEGYAVEGHVPAQDIVRLLKDRPKVTGIAVPGMPVGSPGMEVGTRKDPYKVLAFTKDGSTSVFSSAPPRTNRSNETFNRSLTAPHVPRQLLPWKSIWRSARAHRGNGP